MRLGDLDALCEFFQKRYEYLRNASERQLPNGYVEVDLDIQCGAIIAKEFLDKTKTAPTIDPVELRPKGRWKECARADGEPGHRCSCCGADALYRIVSNELGDEYIVEALTLSCPNCVAKMRGAGNA